MAQACGLACLAASPLAAETNVPLALPEAGGLTELPTETTQPVPLANPGFEEQLTGWLPAKPEAFSARSLPGVARAGRACLRFDGAQRTSFVPSLRQPLKEAGPGVYVLRFWIKTRELGTQGKPQDGVRVSLEFTSNDGQRAWPSTEVFRGSADWRQRDLRVFIPPDLKPGTVALSIGRYVGPGGGEALFDDFSLERAVPAPVEVFLRYPNFRGFLPDDGPARVRVWVKVNDAAAKVPARVELLGSESKKVLTSVELPAGTNEKEVEFDSTRWPLGSHTLKASLGDFTHPPHLLRKISAAQRRRLATWFDDRGVLHLNGKPTFPLGFYNAQGWDSTARLDTLAEAQPNFAIDYASWALPLEEQRRYLGQLQQRGLSFLNTVNMVFPGSSYNVLRDPIGKELLPGVTETQDTIENLDRYLTRLAAAMRATPGHAGWYVMDERSFSDVPRHFRQYQTLRRVDPDHPTFGVSDKPAELHFWRDTLDVVGLDPYPLMNMKQDRPLTLVGDWTRAAVEAVQGSRPVWMVLQFFQGWSTDRWSTEEELRSMSLMAITEGARGLFYWSYGVRGLKWVKDPAEQREYWRRAVAVCRELHRLEPALLAPDAPNVVRSVSHPQIRWRARAAAGKWYVFAYRPARKFSERAAQPTAEVTFTLKNGNKVTRRFAPDVADWFEVTP